MGLELLPPASSQAVGSLLGDIEHHALATSHMGRAGSPMGSPTEIYPNCKRL